MNYTKGQRHQYLEYSNVAMENFILWKKTGIKAFFNVFLHYVYAANMVLNNFDLL